VKRSVLKDRSDESEKLCVHNTRKRNHSLESDTSKTSDVKDIKLEDSETGCRRNVKKRHLSLDSNSSKTSVKSEKVKEKCRPSSNNIVLMEKNVKKHKRKSADKEIMANHDPSPKHISLSKSDEIDGLEKSASQRNLRERKTVEPYKVVKQKINAGKELESLSKTLHTVNNDIQEAGEESQNAFFDSFKKFVGISNKSITNQIKSLKQGKSSKLRAQAIMCRRKQSLRKSKVVNKIKPNAIRTKNNMVEVVDLVEIKDFRNPNKDVSNEASLSSVIIDLTEDLESLASEQENGAVENDNVKITSTLTKIEENTTSNNKKTSFFDSFLAHVNETGSSVSSIEKHNDPSSTKAVKNCTKVEKSKDNLLSDENNSTTSGLKKVENVPDKNLTEQKNKDQLKCRYFICCTIFTLLKKYGCN
jgi:methylphosphotriester-DNA--protein-cysteine methyltransferase